MPVGGVFLATAIIAWNRDNCDGIIRQNSFRFGTGMGTNAFFAYTIVGPNGLGYTWQEALAAGIVAGVLFLLLSITPARKMIIEAIPANLRLAIGAGIGFFIAFIGLKEAGIIVRNEGTLVGLTNFKDPIALLALFGIVLALICILWTLNSLL